jgi:hypothetical protein
MPGNLNSSTGGYIAPVIVQGVPPGADAIQAALQGQIAALTGLPGDLVRPRWQPMPPAQPDASVSWCSLGSTMIEADEFPYLEHIGGVTYPGQPAPGYSVMSRHATLTVVVSFYGPDCEYYSSALRDGLYVPQNYEPLSEVGLKLRTVHDLARIPELVNNQWINRVDIRVEYRAQWERILPIFDLAGATFVAQSDTGAWAVADVGKTLSQPDQPALDYSHPMNSQYRGAVNP